MSDHPQPDPAKVASLAQQIVKLLSKEDSTTRARAIDGAMTMLGEDNLRRNSNLSPERQEEPEGDDRSDLAGFFKRDEKLKPSDTAFLCAAYHYSQYGPVPFTMEEIRQIADDAGEVIPDRSDSTFHKASKKGKKLFQPSGRGAFKPTASGALFFKEQWSVKPGRKPKPKKTAE